MSSFSQTTIDAFVQCELDTVTTSCSAMDFLNAASMVGGLVTDIENSVATVNDLPDLLTNSITAGTRIYVKSISTVVVAGGNSWIGIDGRKLRQDYFFCELWTWGNNGSGQLGNNTTTASYSPGSVSGGGTTWSAAAGGRYHSVGIKSDGTLWTWGANSYYGRLGNSSQTARSSPGQTISGGTTWCQIDAGRDHTLAVKTDGTLWAWGKGCCGELGIGTTGFSSFRRSPVQTSSGGTTWCFTAAGYQQGSGIKTDGTLWTWGLNAQGQLGTGDVTLKTTPTEISGGGTTWCRTSFGRYTGSGIKTDGTLWTWGRNTEGQLGTGNTTNRSSPGTTVDSGTTWCTVTSKSYSHTLAIKTDGTLWAWGRNANGQVGDGTGGFGIARSSPVTTSGGGTTWCRVASIPGGSLAIKTDGTLWCWGCRNFSCSIVNSPVQFASTFSGWSRIDAAGISSSDGSITVLGITRN
jgi:alpha-tubulin suppressor-like RCC1 family protein